MRTLRAGPLIPPRSPPASALASRVIASLARRWLIAQADGRLSLTAEGERLRSEILDAYSTAMGRFLEALTPEEMGLLSAAVSRLHRLQETASWRYALGHFLSLCTPVRRAAVSGKMLAFGLM
jgi:hypothetical protein